MMPIRKRNLGEHVVHCIIATCFRSGQGRLVCRRQPQKQARHRASPCSAVPGTHCISGSQLFSCPRNLGVDFLQRHVRCSVFSAMRLASRMAATPGLSHLAPTCRENGSPFSSINLAMQIRKYVYKSIPIRSQICAASSFAASSMRNRTDVLAIRKSSFCSVCTGIIHDQRPFASSDSV